MAKYEVIVNVEFCPGVVEGICEAIEAARGKEAKPGFTVKPHMEHIRNAVKSAVNEGLSGGEFEISELGDIRFDKLGENMRAKQAGYRELSGKASAPSKLYQFNRDINKLAKRYGYVQAVKLPELFRVWLGKNDGFFKMVPAPAPVPPAAETPEDEAKSEETPALEAAAK